MKTQTCIHVVRRMEQLGDEPVVFVHCRPMLLDEGVQADWNAKLFEAGLAWGSFINSRCCIAGTGRRWEECPFRQVE